MEKKYIAVLGDIIKSREISAEDRNEVQEKFLAVLNYINEKYKEDILCDFDIISGDSFQGLLVDIKSLMYIIRDVELKMYPVNLRFGIGIGGLNIKPYDRKSSYLDGSSYHVAVRMLKNIKACEDGYASPNRNAMIFADRLEKNDESIFNLTNIVLSLCTDIKRIWTQKQVETMIEFIENDENQIQVARAMGIGQSTVSRSLKSSHYFSYKNAIEEVQSELNDYWSRSIED